MKKVFLTTTAMSLIAAGSAFAEEPTVSLGGHIDVQFATTDVDESYQNDSHARNSATRTEADVIIAVDGKGDNGIAYGAELILNADASESNGQDTDNGIAEEISVYVETGFGKVKAGTTRGSNEALKVDAGTIARATGGINGDFREYVNLSGDTSDSLDLEDWFLITPSLPSVGRPQVMTNAYYDDQDDREVESATANKISYYSPRISGVQAAVSYAPSLAERGATNGADADGDEGNDIENLIEVGVNYQGQYDQVGVEASITAEFASLEDGADVGDDDVEAIAYGIALDYAGVTVAASLGYADEFGSTSGSKEYSYYTLGAAYEFGPIGASATYLSSEVENGSVNDTSDAEFSNFVVGLDYQLAPGLVPYVEASFFDTDNNISTDTDNDGTVVIFGTGLSF